MGAHTPGQIEIVGGSYPCFRNIRGLSFSVSVVMFATDLSLEDEMKREADLQRIVKTWNAHDSLSAEVTRLSDVVAHFVATAEKALDDCGDLIGTDAGRELQDAINKARNAS
jgi:hypothetical protein